MVAGVVADPEKPRTGNGWSRFKDNDPSTDCESYKRRSIAVSVMDNLINNLEDKVTDRKHTVIFSLLPSVCLSEHFHLDTSTDELINHFGDKLPCKISTTYRSELKRWVKQWGIGL